MSTLIRLSLTGVLVWLIYGEAGWATAAFAMLVAIRCELHGFGLNIHEDRLDAHIDRIRALTYRDGRPR